MSTYWTGKGYGISDTLDIMGRPLLTYQGPSDKRPFLISDRVAQTFDFTIAQKLTPGAMKNDRLQSDVASFIKTKLGGGTDDELDHKISLELGGSNAPSNLMVQPGIANGPSAASDQLENGLAVDVAAGRISLLSAWRTLAEQKGFLLGEDSKIGTTFSFSELASNIFNIAKNAVAGKKPAPLSQAAILLQKQMKEDVAKLAQDPLNMKLQTKIFMDNSTNISNQLGTDINESGSVNKTMLASYAQSKGIDPRELIGGLNLNVQRILNNSSADPNIFGIPSSTIIKITALLQTTSTVMVTGGLILAIIGIFIAGPEVILGALSGGLLESIGAIFGVSALTGIGLTAFTFGEAMTVASIGMNMTVKETYDNTYLLPTQNINALKEALAIQKGLAAYLPSTITASTPKTGGTTQSVPANKVKVFTGLVSQGTLTAVTDFTPRTSNFIESVDDLQTAAQNNLAPFIASLGGKIIYEVKIVSSVTSADGFKQTGTSQTIITGYTKAGVAKHKTIFNKFATLTLYLMNDKGTKTKIKTIVLGPTNSVTLQPTQAEITALQGNLSDEFHTSDINDITAIKTTSTVQTVTPPLELPGTPTTTKPHDDPSYQYDTLTGLPNSKYIAPTPAPVSTPSAPVVTPPQTGSLPAAFNPNTGTPLYVGQTASKDGINYVGTTPAPGSATTPPPVTTAKNTPPAGDNASTLSEWYQARGRAFPSVQERSVFWEGDGFGPASSYVGSAEQNTILLNDFKKKARASQN